MMVIMVAAAFTVVGFVFANCRRMSRFYRSAPLEISLSTSILRRNI